MKMKITDLTPETENQYFCCLEEWSEDMKDAGNGKQKWYEYMKDKGLRVKFAIDDNNAIGGMIQYVPAEHSMIEGKNLYVVLCIWVHGHKQGRGDFRKKGMGKALLKAAEEDSRNLGASGLVTWGLIIPVFMRASWFRRQGYKVVDRDGIMRLMWKPFNDAATAPKFIRPRRLPAKGKDKVDVTIFKNGWCPNFNIAYERTIRAAEEFPGKINLNEYDTKSRGVVEDWGITDSIFIDGKKINIGPAPTYEKIRKKIAKKVKKLS